MTSTRQSRSTPPKSNNTTFHSNNAVSDNRISQKSTASSQTTWLGKVNTDWDFPDNWSNSVPSATNHAFIPATTNDENFPVISGFLIINFTIKNDGLLTIEGTVEMHPEGMVQNEGTVEIINIGTLINEGKFFNFNTLFNKGTIENKNLITNAGTITNEGVFDNEGVVHNLDELLNSGFIDTDTELVDEGLIENYNHIEFHL